jgi:Tol biopolymer transport system component
MTVNSSGSDQHPAISANGLSLYITSNRSGGSGGDDIWVSKRTGLQDPWEPPVNLGSVINTSSNDRVPTFSRDGRLMFFGSNRPGGHGGHDLYVSSRPDPNDDFGWTAPVNLGPVINPTADEDGPAYFENVVTGLATLYFTSNRPGGLGDWDIYLSRQNTDGSFSSPTLITELSTPQRDTRTAIRRDGLEIFITSDRPGSVGLLDVWVSMRATTFDLWSPPVNPDPSINTTANDGAPALSADGTTLYFYSNRPGGVGGNDLYVTTRTVN